MALKAESAETAIYRVYYNDLAELDRFRSFDIWHDRIHDHSFLVRMTASEYASVANLSLRIELDQQQTATLFREPADERDGGIPGFSCYRTVEETYASLDQLTETHPTLISKIDIGDSYDKHVAGGPDGYDLNAYVISNQASNTASPKPIFLLLAAVHAREYVTAETATRFAESLVTAYGDDPTATWLLDYFELHVIPQGNPDGRKTAESGISWRKNRNDSYCPASTFGADLNRNGSFQWGYSSSNGSNGSSGNQCAYDFRGDSAASEYETQAFEAYATAVLPDQRAADLTSSAPMTTTGMFISLHSYDESILPAWSWTNYFDNPNFEGLNAIGRKMAYFNGYKVYGTGAGFASPAEGTHDDFVYGQFGVPAFTFEMGTTFFQSCSSFEQTVYPDNQSALTYAFKATRQPYQQAFGPDVVDLTLNGTQTDTITLIQGAPLTVTATVDDQRYRYNDPDQAQAMYGVNEFVSAEPIAAVTLYLDQPSWASPSSSIHLTATDGSFDSAVETISGNIDTSGWPLGKRLVFIEATDSSATTGIPTALFVDVIAEPDPMTNNIYLPMVMNAAPDD